MFFPRSPIDRGPSEAVPHVCANAGVDIDAGDALVENKAAGADRRCVPACFAGIGGFGALFELPKGYREPVLVSGTDGVGTKLKLAFELGRHDTIGIDLVAMSVNDILTQGADPSSFSTTTRAAGSTSRPRPRS